MVFLGTRSYLSASISSQNNRLHWVIRYQQHGRYLQGDTDSNLSQGHQFEVSTNYFNCDLNSLQFSNSVSSYIILFCIISMSVAWVYEWACAHQCLHYIYIKYQESTYLISLHSGQPKYTMLSTNRQIFKFIELKLKWKRPTLKRKVIKGSPIRRRGYYTSTIAALTMVAALVIIMRKANLIISIMLDAILKHNLQKAFIINGSYNCWPLLLAKADCV